MLGVDRPGSMLNFLSFDILHSGKSLMGSLYGGVKPKSDIPILLKRYMDKVIESVFLSSLFLLWEYIELRYHELRSLNY